MSYKETNTALNTTFDPTAISPDITSVNVQAALESLKLYIDAEISASEGLCCVEDKDVTDPSTLTPATGEQWIVAAGAIGDWAGEDEKIARYNGSGWDFITPSHGQQAFVKDEDVLYLYTGGDHATGTWTIISSTVDHGLLSGLADDDHTQYSLVDGSRDYTGNIGTSAAAPTLSKHLTRLDYVEAGHEAMRVESGTTYTATSLDQIILVNHSAPFTLTLPAATDGKIYTVKDISAGGASANSITIDGDAAETIDGNATFVISSDKTALRLAGDAGTGWYLV